MPLNGNKNLKFEESWAEKTVNIVMFVRCILTCKPGNRKSTPRVWCVWYVIHCDVVTPQIRPCSVFFSSVWEFRWQKEERGRPRAWRWRFLFPQSSRSESGSVEELYHIILVQQERERGLDAVQVSTGECVCRSRAHRCRWSGTGWGGGGEPAGGRAGCELCLKAGGHAGFWTKPSKPTYLDCVIASLSGTVWKGRNRGYDTFKEWLWVCSELRVSVSVMRNDQQNNRSMPETAVWRCSTKHWDDCFLHSDLTSITFSSLSQRLKKCFQSWYFREFDFVELKYLVYDYQINRLVDAALCIDKHWHKDIVSQNKLHLKMKIMIPTVTLFLAFRICGYF